jgi:hypothetical protein
VKREELARHIVPQRSSLNPPMIDGVHLRGSALPTAPRALCLLP